MSVSTSWTSVSIHLKWLWHALACAGGIHSEELFRKTMKSVLEESFEATVEEKNIQGEQFDLVVMKNGDHILVETGAISWSDWTARRLSIFPKWGLCRRGSY